MTSAGSLQQLLRNLDGSAASVQNAASAMIKHYDQTAAVAVTEWRNALSTSSNPKHLISLLYVANEVLQISKRNRGNKFLEAFSTILGQSLQHICRQDPSLTEKVRRTVKIWGDRRVFSVRFVQELLLGLDNFRGVGAGQPVPASSSSRRPPAPQPAAASSKPAPHGTTTSSNLPSSRPTFLDDDNDHQRERFSPEQSSPQNSTPAATTENEDGSMDEDVIEILEAKDNKDDDDDDDDDIFASDDPLLKVDIDLEQVAGATETTDATPKVSKRRRGSLESAGSGASGGKRRRRTSATKSTALSTNSLLELSSTVTKLQDDFQDSQRALARIDKNLAKASVEELGQIVGDELMVEFRKVVRYQEQVAAERKRLHAIAQERKGLEQEALSYLPWLERALEQDQKDVEFCGRLEKDLEAFLPIHTILKQAREVRRAEELKRLELEAERDRVRREKEESERFRQESLRRQTEQSDGMVWNPTTREYVHLDTEESWRD